MAVARQILTNPANKNQGYVFYTNGFMQAFGGAIQPDFQAPAGIFGDTWSTSGGPPLWTNGDYARAAQVIDWSIPRGYTIDQFGFVYPWGGAAGVPGATPPFTTGPDYLLGGNGGSIFPQYGFVMDFMMDPGNTGQGYMLLANGDVWAIGTGVTAVAHTPYTYITLARQLVMDWTSKRYWVLDQLGRIAGFNGGNHPVITDPPGLPGAALTYPAYTARRALNWYWGFFALYDFSANPKGWMINSFGEVYKIGAAQDVSGYESTVYVQQWSGLAIADDGTGGNPLRLRQMTAQGRLRDFVVSTSPVAAVTEPTGVFSAANKPWVGWQYIDREGDVQAGYDVRIITSSAYLSGTTNEVQTLAVTGAPTGGTFKLGFQRSANAPVAATADIARNASAATVQAALEAIPSIGTGGVVCAGGPLGTAGVTVTFQNQMAGWGWPLLALYQNAMTGGSSPTVTRTMTTAGVGVDPAAVANVFSQSGPDSSTRVRSTNDLANSTTFRAFVRATDSSGLVGAWDYSQFSTAYTALSIPTLVVGSLDGLAGQQIGVSATTGTGLPAAARVGVQYADIVDGSMNLLDPADSDVEASISGWSAEFNCAVAQSSAVGGYSGSQALRLTSSGAGDMGARSQASKQVPVIPGNSYSAAAYVYSAAAQRNCAILVFWKNAAGGSISNVSSIAAPSTVGAWARVAGNGYVAPAGAVWADIQLRVNATAGAGEVHYYDAVQFVTGPVAPASFLPGTGPLLQSSVWKNVRGGDALDPDASGNAVVVDYEAPFGVQRIYRATTWVYDSTSDLWQQSAWSSLAPGTLTPQTSWSLTNPFNSSQAMIIRLQSFETVAPVVVGKFFPVKRTDPIMMSDGAPKLPTIELNIWALSPAERAELEALCNADTTLLLRNFYGECFYIRLDSEFRRTYLRSSPQRNETTPLRDAKTIRVTTQAVKRPVAGPTSGPLVEA